MAVRYIGAARVEIKYNDRNDSYEGKVTVPKGHGPAGYTWHFDELRAPAAGLYGARRQRVSADSPPAYDQMAASAVSFGSYYTTHNRGADTPDWAPEPEVADAIDDATSYTTDDQGNYEVRRDKRFG